MISPYHLTVKLNYFESMFNILLCAHRQGNALAGMRRERERERERGQNGYVCI